MNFQVFSCLLGSETLIFMFGAQNSCLFLLGVQRLIFDSSQFTIQLFYIVLAIGQNPTDD